MSTGSGLLLAPGAPEFAALLLEVDLDWEVWDVVMFFSSDCTVRQSRRISRGSESSVGIVDARPTTGGLSELPETATDEVETVAELEVLLEVPVVVAAEWK